MSGEESCQVGTRERLLGLLCRQRQQEPLAGVWILSVIMGPGGGGDIGELSPGPGARGGVWGGGCGDEETGVRRDGPR